MDSLPERPPRERTRRRRAVVVLLSADDFAVLEANAREYGHETYRHAHWLLARSLGLALPAAERTDDDDNPPLIVESAFAAALESSAEAER